MNAQVAGYRYLQRQAGFDTDKIEAMHLIATGAPMTQAQMESRTIIDGMKATCCCPDCGGWQRPDLPAALHPCPPNGWYSDDNPYLTV